MRDRITIEQDSDVSDPARHDAVSGAGLSGAQGGLRLQGRGGVGNYVSATGNHYETTNESAKSKFEDGQLSLQPNPDLETGLKRPDKAYLGPEQHTKPGLDQGR